MNYFHCTDVVAKFISFILFVSFHVLIIEKLTFYRVSINGCKRIIIIFFCPFLITYAATDGPRTCGPWTTTLSNTGVELINFGELFVFRFNLSAAILVLFSLRC